MNIKSYLNLYCLLESSKITREENRTFGLTNKMYKKRPIAQLIAWTNAHIGTLHKPTLGERFDSYLYGVSMALVFLAFIFGLFSGVALLSYNGHEPVNVVYFLAMVVIFPLFTMALTLLSMLRANTAHSVLVHISPAFWMEKLASLLPNTIKEEIKEFKINPLLANWVVIKRSQVIALFFSLGLFFALLAMVTTKDIAFAWSTTLNITPEDFHTFLHTVSLPWRDFLPSSIPSVELVQHSQYFRLGDKLSEEMITNASKLGEWWKFLAICTLFYALFLRFLMYVLASIGLNRAIKKSLLTLAGAKKLLGEINEPIISTHAQTQEEAFISSELDYAQILSTLDASYDGVQGWAISIEKLIVLCDSLAVISPKFFEVGGAKSFDDDHDVLSKSKGEVLLFVKGWEPPTMDIVDYIEELSSKVDKIVLVPVGTAENDYVITASSVDVWDRKLSRINEDKVWLKR
jgi:hypothetical protein